MMTTLRTAYIDLNALRANFRQVKLKAPQCFVLAMVKANAYGHGLVRVAQALVQADALGVADIAAAIRLREAGISQRIVLMSGFTTVEELTELVRYGIDALVHASFQVDLMSHCSSPISVWLKVNTGMNRLGVNPSEAVSLYQRLVARSNIKKPIPLVTHFSCADSQSGCDVTQDQIKQFYKVMTQLEGDVQPSLSHSAGIVRYPSTCLGWVRPGIMLYGVSPMSSGEGIDYGLQPVMTLSSQIIATRTVQKGEAVGYGRIWQSPCDKRIGIVAIGYGDGYPRNIAAGTPVLIEGMECPIVGRISMDMLTVDVTLCSKATVGSRVVLWGQGLPVERIATAAGTIPYELLCSVTQRVRYVFVE